MAYHNTGNARHKTLIVTKGNYSQSYNICAHFADPANETVTYGALSDDDFRRLTDSQYQARLAAFCRFVYDQEDGLQEDCPDLTIGAEIYDLVACPIKV